MDYPARVAYRNQTEASSYDAVRFNSIKGKLADKLEKNAIGKLLAGIAPGSLVLDVACGTGRITSFLWDKQMQAWGADISREMMEVAQKKLISENKHARFFQAEAETLPFETGTFAAVTAIKLLGHVPPDSRVRILKELGRVCRGSIIVAYYFSSPPHNLKRSLRKFVTKTNSPWFPVTSSEVEEEVRRAGLRIEEIVAVAPLLSETKILRLVRDENFTGA
ncbi:MAG: class I SAM-dependent methyltransferase [candidate division Zixibacteria bacterium]|nr:class I SAM-dependent methyltransferase [candidate division Zixibacteria bacterium]